MKRVLFLLPYPLHRAPSQRFRVEAYFHLLKEHNVEFSTNEFLDESDFLILYNKGNTLRKTIAVCKGYLKRWNITLFKAHRYDYVFIHRETAPLGPPIFEWILARLLKKKIIYDFDDAIWIPNTSRENSLISWLKAFWKIKYICRWAYKIAAGNQYLCSYAQQFNDRVFLLPTCVDTKKLHNKLKDQQTQKVVIGWTGSHSTMKYLNGIIPVIRKIVEEFNIEVIIISNKKPDFVLPNLRYISWNESSEIEDLMKFNIGLMPLENDDWSEGKCGFKLIQYMALGIPPVASPVGVNKQIVIDGVNGYLTSNEKEWLEALEKLIVDSSLRNKMGLQGQRKIVDQFSIQAHSKTFLNLFC